MRISYTQDEQSLLKDLSYTTWRFKNCRENQHRKDTNKIFFSRTRFRRDTQH